MKKIISLSIALILTILLLSGCQVNKEKQYDRYSYTFLDTFDTVVQVVGYTETEEEFNHYMEKIQARFSELHKLYDIYNSYEGINNIKTINDNAGIEPVEVSKDILDLIILSKDWHHVGDGQTNIAMGSVFKLWHDYRAEGEYDPRTAAIPPMEKLIEAAKHADINNVIVDIEKSTVFLTDEKMRLDVGAVAKGYVAEVVAQEIMKEGFTSGVISAGGNIRALDKPLDPNREKWGIGIQAPDGLTLPGHNDIIETVFLNNASVVTSGDYQRYYFVDGKAYLLLIDPKTLMPGEYYRSVTVVTEDSGIADVISTAAFLMPFDESKKLIEAFDGVEALWIMLDETIEATDGLKEIIKSHGATGTK